MKIWMINKIIVTLQVVVGISLLQPVGGISLTHI